MVKPVTPESVISKKLEIFPDFVIEEVNKLIAENFNNGYATFEKDVLVSRLKAYPGQFQVWWLDIEPIYRESGWVVEYDSPGYDESYSATYTFKVKGKH